MARIPFLLKPSRKADSQPVLSKEDAAKNLSLGAQTSIVLDLNILNLLREALDPASQMTVEERKLIEIRHYFDIPFVFLAPGFALGEADESYLEPLHAAFEEFLKRFCPGYVDAPNAIKDYGSRERSRRFFSLPEIDQLMYVGSYLALLKIHHIILSHPKSSGEAKFDQFLEYMDGVANFVPALEAEVAKFSFFDRTSTTDTPVGRSNSPTSGHLKFPHPLTA